MDDPKFTKKLGRFYQIDEVDLYIKVLQKSYIEIQEELENLKSLLDRKETENENLKKRCEQYISENHVLQQEKESLTELLNKQEEATEILNHQLLELKQKKSVDQQNKLGSVQEGPEVTHSKEIEVLKDKVRGLEEALKETEQQLTVKTRELEAKNHEIESLQIDSGEADKYLSLYSMTKETANEYVRKIEEIMKDKQAEAETKIQILNEKSSKKAFEIVQSAKMEAEAIETEANEYVRKVEEEMRLKNEEAEKIREKMLYETQQEIENITNKAKEEYAQIRSLIENSSREYMELSQRVRSI